MELILPKKLFRALVFRRDSLSAKYLATYYMPSSEKTTQEAVRLGAEWPNITQS
jgi:hypothetical protein